MSNDLDLLIRVSPTADDIAESVTEVLRRVIIDEWIDARVEVGEAVPQHLGGHVDAAVVG